MIVVVLFLALAYFCIGMLSVVHIRNFALQCGDEFDVIDFLMILFLWPFYISFKDGDGSEEG